MDWLEKFAGILYISAFIIYIWNIYKTREQVIGTPGKAEPEKQCWIVWTCLDTIMLGGMYASANSVNWQGVSAVIGILAVTLFTLIYGVSGWTWGEKICLALSIFGLILWQTLSNPVLAILACFIGSVIGSLRTWVSAWKDSSHENILAWTIFSIGSLLALIVLWAQGKWTISEVALSLDCFMIDGIVTAILYIRLFWPSKSKRGITFTWRTFLSRIYQSPRHVCP